MWAPKPKKEFNALKKSKLSAGDIKAKLPRHLYKKLKRHNDTLAEQRQEQPIVVKVDKATEALFKEKFGESSKVDVSIPEYAYVQKVAYNNRLHGQNVAKARAKASVKMHYTTFAKNYL